MVLDPQLRKVLIVCLLAVLVSAVGKLGYEAWKHPEAFRSHFQRWRGSEALGVRVAGVEARRVEDHVQLTVRCDFRQSGSGPLRLEAPKVVLMQAPATGQGGHAVERFTGALLEEPVLPGAGPARVALYFWLPAAELNGLLWLTVDGESVVIKNEPGFAVDSLPNGQTVGLSVPQGNILPGATSS